MLTPSEVLPFLQHDDRLVRRRVVDYFKSANDFGPLTADHYWAVIDRFGECEETLSVISDLDDLPQTESSLHRLVSAMNCKFSELFEFHLQHAARNCTLDVASRHREELLGIATLLPHVKRHLELRLSLLDHPVDDLWDRLTDRGRKLGGAYLNSFDKSEPDAWVEAIGRSADPVVMARAIEVLKNPQARDDWRGIFAVRVLGEARHAPAINDLIAQLLIDTDVARDEVTRALTRIGTPEVIDRIVAFYPGKPWHVRLYAGSPLGRIKRPQSETALLELLKVEHELEYHPDPDDENDDLKDHLLHKLNRLCSVAGLDDARRLLTEFPNDPEILDVFEGLMATSIMTGLEIGVPAALERKIRRYDTKDSNKGLNETGLFSRFRDSWRRTGITSPPQSPGPSARDKLRGGILDDDFESVGSRSRDYDSEAPLVPIKAEPRTGRNDPCPCGSGKKYKKCCGAN